MHRRVVKAGLIMVSSRSQCEHMDLLQCPESCICSLPQCGDSCIPSPCAVGVGLGLIIGTGAWWDNCM